MDFMDSYRYQIKLLDAYGGSYLLRKDGSIKNSIAPWEGAKEDAKKLSKKLIWSDCRIRNDTSGKAIINTKIIPVEGAPALSSEYEFIIQDFSDLVRCIIAILCAICLAARLGLKKKNKWMIKFIEEKININIQDSLIQVGIL